MKRYKKAILPKYFKANAIACGIKKSGKLDLALFLSGVPSKASCLFTTNKILAAPIKVSKEHLKKVRYFKGIIVNSGNANCFTGNAGVEDAQEVSKNLAGILDIKPQSILVNSTGIIGKRLPLSKILNALPGLVAGLSEEGVHRAKKAIMTTDTYAKEITVKFNMGDKVITICGIAKGAGMIAPDMATMLAFIFTDASITQDALDIALRQSVNSSFNCITVDGCMSTNDSVMILANGTAGNATIDSNKNFDLFLNALNTVCLELAKMIVKDAEGATKFIQICVDKAKGFAQARKVALYIANSNLFKCAVYGENPNFGRIAAAVGASGVDVKEEDLKIKVSPLNKKEIYICVSVNRGKYCATVYTSDLTPKYVKINAKYN
ncbi:MAG: bifunctional glutamate N-acetyltransferase/amino-acid acetyltransferase ArgJ [Candidatus Omnitrophota bacterium]